MYRRKNIRYVQHSAHCVRSMRERSVLFVVMTVAMLSVLSVVLSSSLNAGLVGADTFVRLHNGRKVAVSPDGTKIVITSWNEHAIISASITNNGLTRFAMVSDTIMARTNLASAEGTLSAGYIVGCQFDVTSAQFSGNLQGNIGHYPLQLYPTPSLSGTPRASAGLDANVPITPGVVTTVNIQSQDFSGGTAIIQIQDHQITAVSSNDASTDLPCAGYAQARSFSKVVVKGGQYALTTTLYGQPFGIG